MLDLLSLWFPQSRSLNPKVVKQLVGAMRNTANLNVECCTAWEILLSGASR